MLLAIDSGNTNVVFAIYDGETQRGRWRASSDPDRTADEYAVWLTQLMALEALTPGDVDGAVLANVVPAARYALETLCRRYFGTEPTIIDAPGVDLGVEHARVLAAVRVEVGADLGGDGETGGNGQADAGHLGQVGTLAAEQRLHGAVAVGLSAAEVVNVHLAAGLSAGRGLAPGRRLAFGRGAFP